MRNVQSVADLASALIEGKTEMEAAQAGLDVAIRDAAGRDRDYRRAWAVAYARSMGNSAAAQKADADNATIDERYEAKLAEDLRVAALERVRSARTLFSGVQTLTNAWREEVAFARGGGDVGVGG